MRTKNRRRKFGKSGELETDMVLQITSMADIFTIILVFILKSSSSGVASVSPSKNVILPEIVKKSEPIVETMKIEISDVAVLIDQEPIVHLEDYHFGYDDQDSSGGSKILIQAFEKKKEENSLKNLKGMLVIADQDVPFSTLKRVLASASLAGVYDYKLVVAEAQ